MSSAEDQDASQEGLSNDEVENIVALPVERIVVDGSVCLQKDGYTYNVHRSGGLISLVRLERESLAQYTKRFACIVENWIMEVPGDDFWTRSEIALNLATWQLMVAYQGFDPLITIITFNYYCTNPKRKTSPS